MKQFIIILLSAILLFTYNIQAFASGKSESDYTQSEQKLVAYLNTNNSELLISRKNYGYMTFVENFRSNVLSLYLIDMTDKLIDTGSEPNQQKYIEVLTNIIATYDLSNSEDITEQCKLDNMKSFKDYAMDFAAIGKNVISVIVGNNPRANQFESQIATAVDTLYVLSENTYNWIDAMSDLETILQNYYKYDNFLSLIEEKAKGDLKTAASILRNSITKSMEIKLDTYIEVSTKNYKNYEEYFFSDKFFPILREIPEYSSDENIKFFVDCGDKFISNASLLKNSWELGTLVGKTVGNITVNGEDLINRVLEMMAIYDISELLQDEILTEGIACLQSLNEGSHQYSAIENYIFYSQFLVGCRIRGEYCLYSIVANDAGLLSWFNKQSGEEAQKWYEIKSEKILNIEKALLDIKERDAKNIKENISAKMENTFPDTYPYISKLTVSLDDGTTTEVIYDEKLKNNTSGWFGEVATGDLNKDGYDEIVVNLSWIGSTYGATDVYIYEIVDNKLENILQIGDENINSLYPKLYTCIGAKIDKNYLHIFGESDEGNDSVRIRWANGTWVE